jgi:hypothetical protein
MNDVAAAFPSAQAHDDENDDSSQHQADKEASDDCRVLEGGIVTECCLRQLPGP